MEINLKKHKTKEEFMKDMENIWTKYYAENDEMIIPGELVCYSNNIFTLRNMTGNNNQCIYMNFDKYLVVYFNEYSNKPTTKLVNVSFNELKPGDIFRYSTSEIWDKTNLKLKIIDKICPNGNIFYMFWDDGFLNGRLPISSNINKSSVARFQKAVPL